MLATSSGQRKYELPCGDDSASHSDSDADSDDEGGGKGASQIDTGSILAIDSEPAGIDNSVSLWTLPGEYVWYVNGQRWTDQSSQSTQEGVTKKESEEGVDSAMTELDDRIPSSTPSRDVVMEATTPVSANS